MEEKVRQELSRIVESMGMLIPGFPWGIAGIVETNSANWELILRSRSLFQPTPDQEIVDGLRRLRNDSQQNWLIVLVSEEEIESMSPSFLRNIEKEVRSYRQSIVFVAPHGAWPSWVKRLRDLSLIGLLDCSRRFELSI